MTLPAGLSMLWEAADPQQALGERFGFDDLPAVSGWVRATLAEDWRLDAADVDRVAISSTNAVIWARTDRGAVVITWSGDATRFGTLEATAGLLQHLDRQGLPVAAPWPTVDGSARIVRSGPAGPLSIMVLPEIAGDWLDVGDPAAVRSAGVTLGRLHLALQDYADPRLVSMPRVPISRPAIETWLESRLENSGQDPAPATLRLRQLLAELPDLDVSPQLVHSDFRSANLLTRRSEIVAVLDFDDVAVGHAVADMAQASVYLSTRFTDWGPTPDAVRQQLRAGYESVRPLSITEAHWYEILVLWLDLRVGWQVDQPA